MFVDAFNVSKDAISTPLLTCDHYISFIAVFEGNQLVPQQPTVAETVHGGHTNQTLGWRKNPVSTTTKRHFYALIHTLQI